MFSRVCGLRLLSFVLINSTVFPAKALADDLANTHFLATVTVPLSGSATAQETGLRLRIFRQDAARIAPGESRGETFPVLDLGLTIKHTQEPAPEPPAGLSQQP